MARFNIAVKDNKVHVGLGYHADEIEIADMDAFIVALQAAKVFAEANADLPKPVAEIDKSAAE